MTSSISTAITAPAMTPPSPADPLPPPRGSVDVGEAEGRGVPVSTLLVVAAIEDVIQ